MPSESYAGFTLQKRLSATAADIARWQAEGDDGTADVFLGPVSMLDKVRTLPSWGPFPSITHGKQDGIGFVVVPGMLAEQSPTE